MMASSSSPPLSTHPMVTFSFLFITLLFCYSSATHNITHILADFPDYSRYNTYLSQTKVCDEINSRETVTVLVLSNSVTSTLVAKHPLPGIKNALRLHTLLDYFDSTKLHSVHQGTVLAATLLQTTGTTTGNQGFVNITNLKGGKIGLKSPYSVTFASFYTKSVRQFPYSISVLEISAPVLFPQLLDGPVGSTGNITTLLEEAGCKTFASLITLSGVIKLYESQMDKGLTVFAPNDEAFKAANVPDLTKLSQAELVILLKYHALPEYAPKSSLETKKAPMSTLASNDDARKYSLSVVTRGDDVSVVAGLDSSRVANTILDNTPVSVLAVDSVLLPTELFGRAPLQAPESEPSPPSHAPRGGKSRGVKSPAKSPKAKSPPPASSPSPPSSPTQSPEESPVGAPEDSVADLEHETAAATETRATLAFLVAVFIASWLPLVNY